jgi:hypothetical protein
MRLRIRNLACLAAIVVGSAGFAPAAYGFAPASFPPAASPPPPDSRPVVSLTAAGVTLEWNVPPVEITAQAGGTVSVALPGYTSEGEPGKPSLPVASALVALPPGAAPTLELLQLDEQTLPLSAPLAASPFPEAGEAASAVSPRAMGWESPEPVRLKLVGSLHGVSLARVIFYPVRPASDELRVTTLARVAVNFNAPLLAASLPLPNPDPVLATVQAAVVNPSQLQPVLAAPSTVSALSAGSTPQVAVEVNAPGLTAISYNALAALDFTVNVTGNLHLTRAGVEVAIQQDDAGQRLLFYADPRFSRWTATDVYFLWEDSSPGLRMTSRSADPAGLVGGQALVETASEVNYLYMPSYCHCGQTSPGRDGDQWTWDALRKPDRLTATYPITLTAVDTSRPATLTVWLIGYTDILTTTLDHRVSVALNETNLGSVEWDGKQAITATLSIPAAGILKNGSNSLRLTLPGISGVTVEGAWLDAFSIRHARSSAVVGQMALFAGEPISRSYSIGLASVSGLRAYDVTDPSHPVTLTGFALAGNVVTLGDPAGSLPRRYALASDSGSGIQTPARLRLATPLVALNPDARYVMIVYPDFTRALTDLVDLRQSQNLTVTIQNVQAVYDAYGGRPEPEAIRAYLRDVYTSTQPSPPWYVLLVGDGTYDPKRYRTTSTATFVPPYLGNVDSDGSETATDNRYVVFTDTVQLLALPEMLIGRLPVNTLTQTQAVVNKIVSYETDPPVGDWNRTAAFVADKSGWGEFFSMQSDQVARLIASPFVTQTLYYNQPYTFDTLKTALFRRLNYGPGLLVFTGHASIHQWSQDRLFHSDDVASLVNGPRLPVLLEATCFTGSFHVPDSETLDEALVRHAGGGAVAVWGATGLGYSTGHVALATGFLGDIYQPDATVGTAALAGKLNLSSDYPDLVDTYTVLGDPATRMNITIRPWPFNLYLPMIRR